MKEEEEGWSDAGQGESLSGNSSASAPVSSYWNSQQWSAKIMLKLNDEFYFLMQQNGTFFYV